jgi:hypothetical protein
VSEAEAKKKELQSLNKIINGPVPKSHWLGFCLSLGPRPSHAIFYILRFVPSEAEKPWEESSHCGQRPSWISWERRRGLVEIASLKPPKRLSYWFMEISPNEDMKSRIGEQAKWLSAVAVRLGLL